jgi:subtilisin family serine protease
MLRVRSSDQQMPMWLVVSGRWKGHDVLGRGRHTLRQFAVVTAAAVVATALGGLPAAAEGVILHADSPTAVDGSYIVVYRDVAVARGDAATTTDRLAAKHSAKVTHRYDAALRGFAAEMSKEQAARLAADPAVEYVTQDQRVSIAATQTNPPSWGLDRVDQRNLPLNNTYDYATTASNVHVYVIDTGIRTSHGDFGGRASFDFNSADANNTDCNGHGTHVAGTIGGNAYGVAKGVRLHGVKVLNCAGSGTTAGVIAGVDWVTANAVRPAVANMSLGGGVQTALDAAVRNSIASGISYAIAAGNSAADACNYSPARVAEAITVGATTRSDGVASFSNYGRCLDIFAPGQDITSAWHTSNTAATTISGTSMAAPHVAGALALFLSASPSATPSTLRAHLVTVNASRERIALRASDITHHSPNMLLYTRVTPPRAGTDTLWRNGVLTAGQYLRSTGGNFELVMQGDGNLVQYQEGVALWSSGTWGHPGAYAVLQGDSNFVIYSASGAPIWHAPGTWGSGADRLVVQSDCNLVIYRPDGAAVWAKWM